MGIVKTFILVIDITRLIMTNEEKNLLLKDLCSRLPYGVKVSCISDFNHDWYNLELVDITDNEAYISTCEPYYSNRYSDIESIRPYLFPLSSMTEEHRKKLFYLSGIDIIYGKFYTNNEFTLEETLSGINWLLKNHFDINGLIPMGLASDATGLNIY